MWNLILANRKIMCRACRVLYLEKWHLRKNTIHRRVSKLFLTYFSLAEVLCMVVNVSFTIPSAFHQIIIFIIIIGLMLFLNVKQGI